ncbi:cyclin-D3-1-like isoform X2 [Humulus lupulus]|uniref:cyclin-D3-1-like isoform X2 n=1 Tax=Humulus lupulus TaxID=3486 RepID=UPI002B4079C4|nr:cyclin-D3-1-like isoform X2 [Humulus lupulus]
MAPSFDCLVSSLLCSEDNFTFDDNDCGSVVDEVQDDGTAWYHSNHQNHDQNHDKNHDQDKCFDGWDELPLQSDECITSMVEKECQHLPGIDYLERLRSGGLEFGARKEALGWIGKANAHFSFGPLCSYLSISYLDRFLSAYDIPSTVWTAQLLAVTCLSLAAKMDETEVPLAQDLQMCDSKFVFEPITIRRMELLVLSTLKWRMQAVTPFSFLDYFLRKINNDETPAKTSVQRSIQLLLSTVNGIDFLEFKPSEVAAAVAISALAETNTVDTEIAVSVLMQYVEKERVLRCIQLIQDSQLNNGSNGLVRSVPQSPIGVLDAACFSYKNDGTTVGSCANSPHSNSDNKRRRLNIPYEVVEP